MAYSTQEFDVHDATLRAFNPRNLKRIDWLLPLLVLALAAIGWANMFSASRSSDVSLFQKQMVVFAAGAVLALALVCIDYRLLVSLAPLFYGIAVLMLIAVVMFGTRVKGSERWLALGPIRIQPSEFVKLIMVYTLTWYFTMIGARVRKLPWFLLAFVISGVPMALILKQPNLGTAASLGPLTLAMLFVAGCRVSHLAMVLLAGLSLVPVVWWEIRDFDPKTPPETVEQAAAMPVYELRHHQKMRIYTFLHPDADIGGSGWQTYQSKITVGSGGLKGKGYLQGTQTRLNYLPEHHNDFIYSLLAEEHGFFGAVVVIALFAVFLLRGLSYARDCPEMTGTLLAAGVVTILAFHVFVNIAITVGLLPVTGIPLPFLSYGRSFYMTTMACVGVLLNVPMRRGMFTD